MIESELMSKPLFEVVNIPSFISEKIDDILVSIHYGSQEALFIGPVSDFQLDEQSFSIDKGGVKSGGKKEF